jgi:hypothetical protein
MDCPNCGWEEPTCLDEETDYLKRPKILYMCCDYCDFRYVILCSSDGEDRIVGEWIYSDENDLA